MFYILVFYEKKERELQEGDQICMTEEYFHRYRNLKVFQRPKRNQDVPFAFYFSLIFVSMYTFFCPRFPPSIHRIILNRSLTLRRHSEHLDYLYVYSLNRQLEGPIKDSNRLP